MAKIRNPQARKLAGPSCRPRTFHPKKGKGSYSRKLKHRSAS